jgi:hypothetical protein
MSNESQTTPVQWFRDRELPAWTKLSLHDHPPLYFYTTHLFAAAFGDSLFVLRLPSALAGIFSIYLIYLLLRKLTRNEYAGILAAAFLAVNHMHIWISRSILMEALLILLLLAAIYAFLIFLEDKKYWYWLGITMGLVALTKYTGAFLVPAFAIYAAVFRRDIFRTHHLYSAIGLALLIFSPVIIYNALLYKEVGHFDLQLSYLFGQETPEWQASFGKIQYPFSVIGKTMVDMYSILFLMAALGGIVYGIFRLKSGSFPMALFFLSGVVFVTLTLVGTGSAQRFIALYLVPLVPLIAIFLIFLFQKYSAEWWSKIALGIFLVYEMAFVVYGIFIIFPDFGAVKLDKYFDEKLGNLASRHVPEAPNPHLNAVIKKYLATLSPADKSIIIIYDENISLPQRLWIFTRRTFYHGITTLSVRLFKTFLQARGLDAVKGYDLYFVRATENTVLNPYFSTNDAEEFERFLSQELGLQPQTIIRGHKDLPMFVVYKFVL